MHYNTVLNKDTMGDRTNRKAWEVDMALAALKAFGATGKGKTVLGVGAGHEPTIFYLTTLCGRVIATDLYNDAGMWEGAAPAEMLANPGKFVPADLNLNADLSRLTVQHADMRELPFEDNSFDGVFSSGSIEHVGSFDDVARAAKEIGRVLKPGGICTLATEWKIEGTGHGWDGVLLFDPETLWKYIISPSGLVPVDVPYLTVHEDTKVSPVSLEEIVRTDQMPALEMVLRSETHGYLFTSIHLALQKSTVEAVRTYEEAEEQPPAETPERTAEDGGEDAVRIATGPAVVGMGQPGITTTGTRRKARSGR